MTQYTKRMLAIPGIIDINSLHSDANRISIFKQVFEITRSKLTTPLGFVGNTNFTIVDAEPDIDDKFFALALIPTKHIRVIFEDHEDIVLVPGDLLCSAGIQYKTVLTQDDLLAHEGYHFIYVKYAVREKHLHGNGPNKYKASIVFSDKYEIEIFANDEAEARQIALEIPFYDWHHIWPMDESKQYEYRVQKTRHSLWLPEDIKVDIQ